ncbi:hypothetical protein LIER_00880 [Lithospermum erythrorhizon]|uniref:Uncharacterized protein n=1 Tax=Lithospermum erythrorhizon TaxID=34254 RepID=A0AAV3NK64_LITER
MDEHWVGYGQKGSWNADLPIMHRRGCKRLREDWARGSPSRPIMISWCFTSCSSVRNTKSIQNKSMACHCSGRFTPSHRSLQIQKAIGAFMSDQVKHCLLSKKKDSAIIPSLT